MRTKKLKITVTLILLLILTTVNVFAAPYDLSNIKDPKKNFSFYEFIDSPRVFDEILRDLNNYIIEAENGNSYYVTDVDEETSDGTSFKDAVKKLNPYNKVDKENVKASALLIGSILGEDNYALIIYGGDARYVEYILINGKIVEFKIIDDILRVDTKEEINSMELIIGGITVDVSIGSTPETELRLLKSLTDELDRDDYLREFWNDLQDALDMRERTDKEKILKIKAVNIALDNLIGKVHLIGTFNEFYYERKEFEDYYGIESLPLSEVYNIYIDEEKLEDEGIDVSKELNIKMKLDGKFLLDRDENDTFTYFEDGRRKVYILPGVEESINDWTEISPENLGVKYKSKTHPAEIYIINE